MSPLQHLTQVSSWLALYSCECEWGEGGREKGMKREREREREKSESIYYGKGSPHQKPQMVVFQRRVRECTHTEHVETLSKQLTKTHKNN